MIGWLVDWLVGSRPSEMPRRGSVALFQCHASLALPRFHLRFARIKPRAVRGVHKHSVNDGHTLRCEHTCAGSSFSRSLFCSKPGDARFLDMLPPHLHWQFFEPEARFWTGSTFTARFCPPTENTENLRSKSAEMELDDLTDLYNYDQ